MVKLSSLIFFSGEAGDARMHPGDNLALCLARGGQKQPFTITEDSAKFLVEWNTHYCIDGDAFTVTERSGLIRTILGYLTADISEAARRVI